MIPPFIATHALFKTIYLVSATEAFRHEEQYVYLTAGVTKVLGSSKSSFLTKD